MEVETECALDKGTRGRMVVEFKEFLQMLEKGEFGHLAEQTPDAIRKLSIARGFYAADFDTDLGGRGISQMEMSEMRVLAAESGLDLSRYTLAGPEGPTHVLNECTPTQRENWVKPLVKGEVTRCTAMTEHTGGSAFGRSITEAVWDPSRSRWHLKGNKHLISNADSADLAIVMAYARGREKDGPTNFIVPVASNMGWVVRPLAGMHEDYHQFDVEIDVHVSDESILGGIGKLGHATAQALQWLPYGRLTIAARALGLAKFAQETAIEYARNRKLVHGAISENHFIRHMLVENYCSIESCVHMVRKAASKLDSGSDGLLETSTAKLWATECACKIIDNSMQILGGNGWLRDYKLEGAYREARAFRIIDGTSEVQTEIIYNLL
ncbi:acyl-CoA dehydrogenase [Brevibacterium sediminis]|uniref:acyl-CoA dehydrogenase family protein n=1 Tax=Brevibacterium sediminis TaxID=1857024 RepID=UPI0021755664|nr:acyl-CoA dehydrogenase [Brevibacterium sediminis]MCS4592685.1 acyl-CoA dehydrogenase [Brevibacterium sediminis]